MKVTLPAMWFVVVAGHVSERLADSRYEPRRDLSAFALAVPLLLSSLAAFGKEAWSEQRDGASSVSQVDLDAQPYTPAKHDGFIELAGYGCDGCHASGNGRNKILRT